jgi:probable HAF family extracellular repeat protein
MNKSLASTCAFILLVAALTICPDLAAQEQQQVGQSRKQHTRFKVVDTGSLGGPNSHMTNGAHILNNDGTFADFADTTEPDAEIATPDICWDGDCVVAHASRWKHGQLTDLGSLADGWSSESVWVSENGIIAGNSQNGLFDPTGFWQVHGVLWRHGRMVDLGTLDGGYDSLVRAVNSAGEAAGFSTTLIPDDHAMINVVGLPFQFQTRAFRWKAGVIQDLGTLGGRDAMAMGINERGQIFGDSYTDNEPSPGCSFPGFTALTTGAFLWERGRMVNLGSLGGTCTNSSAINNSGQVVGSSFLKDDAVFHPFFWERGKLKDLGTGGGNFGFASALNADGDVVGWVTLPGNDSVIHATLWSRGRIKDLGALGPDECSFPLAINKHRQVVGISGSCDFSDPTLRGFLWEPDTGIRDLNTLISPRLELQLRNAAAINDRGEIAAAAYFLNGNHRPLLLIPCEETSENDEDCDDADRDVNVNLAGRASTALSPANSKPRKLDPRDLLRGWLASRGR